MGKTFWSPFILLLDERAIFKRNINETKITTLLIQYKFLSQQIKFKKKKQKHQN